MRVKFSGDQQLETLNTSFEPIGQFCQMNWQIWPCELKQRVLVLVSKQDHYLADLIYRTKNGEIPIEIALVGSNHRDAYSIAAAEDIDFLHYYLPRLYGGNLAWSQLGNLVFRREIIGHHGPLSDFLWTRKTEWDAPCLGIPC